MGLKMLCYATLPLGLLVGSAAGGIVVRIDPSYQEVNLTARPWVECRILADIPEAEAIVGWGLDLTLDGASVSLVAPVGIGPIWDAVYTPDGDELGGLAFPDPVWGEGVLLATITVNPEALGITQLLLSDDNPLDLTEGFALAGSGFAEVTYILGQIEVIPEPATLFLLLVGGVALIRRR